MARGFRSSCRQDREEFILVPIRLDQFIGFPTVIGLESSPCQVERADQQCHQHEDGDPHNITRSEDDAEGRGHNEVVDQADRQGRGQETRSQARVPGADHHGGEEQRGRALAPDRRARQRQEEYQGDRYHGRTVSSRDRRHSITHHDTSCRPATDWYILRGPNLMRLGGLISGPRSRKDRAS